MRIVALCAMEDEAAPLRHRLASTTQPHDVTVVVSGFGKVNAATTTAHAVATTGADLVVVVGVCGRLVAGDHHTFWLSHAVQHDYGAVRDGGFDRYSAGALPLGPTTVEPFAAITDPGSDLPHATIASGDAFVEDAEHAARLARELGATLVDMEVAAVAQAVGALGVPWAAIKSVTDDADDAGAGDFAANLALAADRAAVAVARLLQALTPAHPPD